MSWYHPRNLLDRTFEAGIILKGIDGVLEAIGGFLLLFATPGAINLVVVALTQSELSEDPHDFVANYVLHTAQHLTGAGVLFGAVYLLAHGLVKMVLVFAILKNKIWAYPGMMAFLGIFIIYQLYRIVVAPSVGLIALTVFDIFIVWLTYLEYRKRRHP